MKSRHFFVISLILAICLSTVAFGRVYDNRPQRANIRPSIARLEPGDQQQFHIVLQASHLMHAMNSNEVTWSVNNIAGGNDELGTIDANGLYTAPAKQPKPHEVHICAKVEDAVNKYVFGTVLVGTVAESYETVYTYSEEIANPKYLGKPHGIGLDKNGDILIADQTGHRVLHFTKDGKYIRDIGLGKGGKPGYFTTPRVVACDAEGDIWVSDSKGDRPRIQVFTADGKFKRIFAEKGILPGQLMRAHGLAFNANQDAFVVDVDNFRVTVYSHDGKLLRTWGKVGSMPGQFNAPHGIAVDPSGDVFVSGYYGPTQKFDEKGNFLFAFGHGDPPDGPVFFHTISGDKWGNVFMMVRNKEGGQGELQKSSTGKKISITKFNNNGDYICGWSLGEPDHRESWAVAGEDGRVYSLFEGETHVGFQVFAPK